VTASANIVTEIAPSRTPSQSQPTGCQVARGSGGTRKTIGCMTRAT